MAPSRHLVLASASPRRKALLAGEGYVFDVTPAEVDESMPPGVDPARGAVVIARRKAEAVRPLAGDAILIAADTIVVTPGGEVLGKPADEADALRMLRGLSGTTHRVITGVAVVDCLTGRALERAVETGIVFGEMSEGEIAEYVASGEAMGKAGAYAIQETGDRFVREVRGSFSNVVGLPMEAIAEMMRRIQESS
jgi:septum formation protein